MKALKPSHREKKRYILVLGKDANQKSIEETILKFLGILGYAKASPQMITICGEAFAYPKIPRNFNIVSSMLF